MDTMVETPTNLTQPTDEMIQTEHNPQSVLVPFSEFAEDVNTKLGRANGNIYIREAGVDNVHDGQIMVRLKKKRFIIIDYSIIPTQHDISTAALSSHIMIPNGAGRTKCTDNNCTKVGIPVCLHDSNPEEPSSLYLRSGLCFTCQRILNEKRRTQRKKKSSTNPPTPVHSGPPPIGAMGHSGLDPNSYSQPQKRFRLNGEILDLNPDAIIINGPLNDTKHHGPGYEFPEIITDLQRITQEVTNETNVLANAISNPNHQEHTNIMAMYEKTFLSMSKGIFLLSQWKSSWDSAVASAVAEKAASEQAAAVTDGTILDGNVIADAVASAAAVAAAQTPTATTATTTTTTSSNMVPLLIAAQATSANVDQQDDDQNTVVEEPEIFGV